MDKRKVEETINSAQREIAIVLAVAVCLVLVLAIAILVIGRAGS